jgi:hypothetical protein
MDKKPIVEVTWIDSVGQGGWHTLEEIGKFTINVNMNSVGYLTRNDEEMVVVSANIGEWNYGNSTLIPKRCIISIETLKE